MVRRFIGLIVMFALGSGAFVASSAADTSSGPAPSPAAGDVLLRNGQELYRAGEYVEAIKTLEAAVKELSSLPEMQRYIDSGHYDSLGKLETALVYLAMSEVKLGKSDEARAFVLRIEAAERVEPTFATLQLDPEVAEFPTFVAALVPTFTLPQNAAVARAAAEIAAGTPMQPIVPAPSPEMQPAPVQPAETASAPAAPATPAPTVGAQPSVAQSSVAQSENVFKQDEQEAAEAERLRVEKQEADRVAAERAAASRAAAERALLEKQEADRVAAERDAAERARLERQEAGRIAAERAAADRLTSEQTAAKRVEAERAERALQDRIAAEHAAEERAAAARAESRGRSFETLRQAEAFANSGRLDDANREYLRLVNAPDVSRETLAAAATGLYRTGSFPAAVRAFQQLGAFNRGEEDLRYYHAVSLYEAGFYGEAKKELRCALPYIELTDEVARYRLKIEGALSAQAPVPAP